MRNIYRLSILCCCFLAMAISARSQTFGNEWIDYSKTYYKFKIANEGIYRISRQTLDAMGIPTIVTGNQYVLYRDGQQVPLYVSTVGAFGANDYIEFYGKGPTGTLDKKLFANPNWHINDSVSLFTDTASYFLTYGVQNYARFMQVNTTFPGTLPPTEQYVWSTSGKYFKNSLMPGTTYSSADHLFSSQFDCAEAYVDAGANFNTPPPAINMPTPNVYAGGPDATVRINVAAQGAYAIQLPIKVFIANQVSKLDTLQLSPKPAAVKKINFPVVSALLQTVTPISYTTNFTNSPGYFNLIGTAQAEIQYARNCDLSNANTFKFSLKATTSDQYLEFTNFDHGGANPKLYDLTNNKWYSGDISTIAGVTRFYLQPSMVERTLILVSQASNANNYTSIAPVRTRNFTNFSVAPNVGNYIIITHNKLMTATDGHNYPNEYRDYRNSADGGSYTVVVADVDELYDQFAYGVDIHPLSIKNFLHYAYTNWSNKPEYALILGRGLRYEKYKEYGQNASTYQFPIVPTYGDPGSDVDFVNFGTNLKAKIKIGRISAWNGMEIGNYLKKVRNYEAALRPAAQPHFTTELWKKKLIHIAGGSDMALQTTLLINLNGGANVITRPYTGDMLTTIAKNTSTPIDQAGSALVNAMIDSGVNWITFHGHASAGNFDFNLNNPEQYNNAPRLPHLMALGCDVSQIFELTTLRTISERYINATGGSISVLAQDNLGYTSFHGPYLQRFYRSMAIHNYNTTLGTHYNHTYDSTILADNISVPDNFTFTEIESLILLGDPAVKVFGVNRPDYHIADESITSIPGTVSTTLDSFDLNITTYNLAKAASDTAAGLKDTVYVKVEHINPQGTVTTIANYPVVNLYNKKDITIKVGVDRGNDLGLNKYRVMIDPDNKYDENSETNNGGLFNLFIFSDNLVPVYPQEFAIVGNQGITLKASTLNPFRPVANYKIEIDTTELFNSPQRQQYATTSMAGLIKWQPNITYQDSMVYYWRAALDSGGSSQPTWTTSSFIYLPQKWGWNQSHYFQYKKDKYSAMVLDNNRQFNYTIANNNLDAFNRIFYPTSQVNDVKVMFNDVDIQRAGCSPYVGTLQVMVLDSATGQRWENPVGGAYGAYGRCFNTRNSQVFEFPINQSGGRNDAKNFINSIPNGHYILIRNFIYNPYADIKYVADWQADGSDNLYTAIKNAGFNQIDSFYKERAFILFCKKGDNSFPVTQLFTQGTTDRVEGHFLIPSRWHSGTLISRNVGPASEWQELKWRVSPYDNLGQNDSVSVKVFGIDNNNNETELFTTLNKDTSIAGISAQQYPNLRMEWFTNDTINNTSAQLEYWRIHYVPLPEAALNPNAHFVFKDSLNKGETAELHLAIEELTGMPMDSMLVKYRVIDAGGVAHDLGTQRYKKLNGNDTLHASIQFDPSSYPGANYLFIEANPANDQPEQYHPNNLGYLPFKVFVDKLNPLIDVTFDGIHILNKDIVSSKPFIKISLKDENKFLKLDDTSLLDVAIAYLGPNPKDNPNAPNLATPPEPVPFDGTMCKFIPAASAEKNEAMIDYKPTFLKDGFYELQVNGKDRSGNKSGATDYRISFEVINKSTITNILNYPNPFSTSTAFLFTLTGSQIPSQFKIQVLSVTGKVVREITKAELGPLHVGRNITEYKWDGKDQYGQMLGNGVYLYRVVTAIDGAKVERRESEADKFTQKGYGKMYIMR